jgi:hypothetical protein
MVGGTFNGKSLLLFFNPLYPGPNKNFTVRTIGNLPNPLSLTFREASANFSQGKGGTCVNISNDIRDPSISLDGEVTIILRIGSYFNYPSEYQSRYLRFDSALDLDLYSNERNYKLNH